MQVCSVSGGPGRRRPPPSVPPVHCRCPPPTPLVEVAVKGVLTPVGGEGGELTLAHASMPRLLLHLTEVGSAQFGLAVAAGAVFPLLPAMSFLMGLAVVGASWGRWCPRRAWTAVSAAASLKAVAVGRGLANRQGTLLLILRLSGGLQLTVSTYELCRGSYPPGFCNGDL